MTPAHGAADATAVGVLMAVYHRDDPAAFDRALRSVLDQRTIESIPADDYGDLLRNIPGLNVSQTSARDVNITPRGSTNTLSTSQLHYVAVGPREMQFRNSNKLVFSPEWSIGLQKTGYIAEAGRCVVMQAELAGRKLIMVLLDSAGTYTRIADAERIRHMITGDVTPATFVMPTT